MAKILKINKRVEQGLQDFFKHLLANQKVAGVLSLKKISDDGAAAYSLITDPAAIDMAVPFYPLMPANAGRLVSKMTLGSSPREMIAAVLKPCELRAFNELLKREQGSRDNILTISAVCPGVFPLKTVISGEIERKLGSYLEDAEKAKISDEIRPTCQACEHFVPYDADITVNMIGKKECEIFLNSEKAVELASGADFEITEGKLESEILEKFRAERKARKEKLLQETDIASEGFSGLVKLFGKCIKCRACREVCPICYCGLCTFDSSQHDSNAASLEKELEKKKGVRLPPGTIFYQMGRVTHMGLSCVGCGMCSDVCPVDIPVSAIFIKAGKSIQDIFNYVPGRSLEEPLPTLIFEKDELTEIED